MEISCVIPVYNVEKYLVKCIDSVLNQTFIDFEIILVDDGSTDQSGEICDNYVSIDSRINVIHQKNGGLSNARNNGIDIAKGKYLIFIDSDDYIDKEMFKTLYYLNKENKTEISVCDKAFVYENKNKIDRGSESKEIFVYNPEEAFVKAVDFYGKFGMEIWNKLYLRELFNLVRFPEGKIFEDQATQYKLIFAATKISYIEYSLYYYLRRENSITTQRYSDKEKERIEMVDQMVSYIKDNHPGILSKVLKYKLLSCDLTIVNKMIKAKTYDYSFLKDIREDIRKELFDIDKKDLNIIRKIQIYLVIHNWDFYQIFYQILYGRKLK